MSGRAIYWRCFHCGEGFTKAQERWAREHFGRDEDKEPVCLIRTAGESSLLTALRNAQDEIDLSRANTDDSDVVRAMVAMQADHSQALIREEERGYAKGVADCRAELTALRARVAEIEAGLKFYAQPWMWRSTSLYMCGHSSPAQIMQDGGAKARAALERKPA